MKLEPRIYTKGGSMLSLEYSGEFVYDTILPILSKIWGMIILKRTKFKDSVKCKGDS